jgi:Tol biopolymer transport system component
LVAIILPVVLAIAVVIVVGRVDNPATVPADFRPPAALPRAAASLPFDQMLLASDRNGTFGIYAMRTNGQQLKPIVEDPAWDSWGVRLAPDRTVALFYRTSAGEKSRDPSRASLWAVATDGASAPVLLRPAGLDKWVVQSHAEWNQYGSAILMSAGSRSNPQIWETDALGQNPRQLTNRPGANTDPSYTPDGREIFFVGCPGDDCEPQDRELYRLAVGGSEPVRLSVDRNRDREPYVSVAGDKLAWLAFTTVAGDGWQIRIADRKGAAVDNPRNLLALTGEDIVGRPQWSNDGAFIYVHRKASGRATTGIYAIATNSPAAPREVTLGQTGNYEDPSL